MGGDFAAGLRESRAAFFVHGFAWDDPRLQPEGQRGLGFIDFATDRTHVVQIATPAGAARRLKSPTSPNPLRRWGVRMLGRLVAARNSPVEARFERGRCEVRSSPNSPWRESQIPNPLWQVQLLSLPPIAVRPVRDQQTSSGDRQVELALDAAAVSEAAPHPKKSVVRAARAVDTPGELPFCLIFSPKARPRQLSLSLGRTAHTSERLWAAIEFIELGPGVLDRDLWEAWNSRVGLVSKAADRPG
jgi:hypothetical protein